MVFKGKKWNVRIITSKQREIFLKSSETERSLLYYVYEYKNFFKDPKKKGFKPAVIDYDGFTKPKKHFSKLQKSLT